MEANFGEENHQLFAAGSSKRFGKKALEWDLNDWKWDGDLFMATPVDPGPLNCLNKQLFPDIMLSNSSSSCSDETEFGVVGKVLGEADKRRRIVAVEDDEQCDDTRSLTLKLGAHSSPVMEEDLNFVGMKNGKRGMVQASNSNHPKCQVENCGADLSQSKDYHRRHKVCEMHAKASSAVVGNVIQRFCQQCSRFHLLQEFDEGKRSCRRRLAGHNRRRRKTLSDATTPSESSAAGDQSAGYLLISLLRILANLNSDRSEQSKDQEFLSNLLRNIASLAGSSDGNNNSSGLLQASQDLQKVGTSAVTAGETSIALISGAVPTKENVNSLCSPAKTVFDPAAATNHCASPEVTNCVSPAVAPREIHGHQNHSVASFDTTVQATCSERLMLKKKCSPDKSRTLCSLQHMLPTALTVAGERKKGFDLNTVYYEEEDGALGGGQPANQATLDIGSSNCPSWILQDSHQASPPQTSGNTDSTSNRSPSSSNGDAQTRTDRIVFKLFGKDPNDFPLVLRAQIFDWLSNSPTDMESYIRPGCIILTVYLRLEVSMWDELCHDLGSSLKRLLFLSNDDFWRMGWIYARVQHHVAFIYNGQVVLNKSLIMERPICSKIVSVTPIAVPPSSRVTFKVEGSNLVRSTTRLLSAFEGKYLSQEINQPTVQYSDSRSNGNRNEQLQSLSLSCYVPDAIGRGFIEIEDNGLSSGFFPFIVAEEDICAEIKMLESSMNLASSEDLSEEKLEAVRTLGMNFLHEMGWLLHRSQLRYSSEAENSCLETFSLLRFRWILRFAIDHDWSAIVKKFLDILFEGNIETDGRFPNEVALSEDLLHYAVQRNSSSTVKLLLRYKPDKVSDGGLNNLFRPDMPGPSGITPLHVAATSSFAESMLNILTDDPAQFGVKAWSNARDTTGFTPEDYARARGHESYILLMQEKINKITEKCDVVVNMPSKLSLPSDAIYKQSEALKSSKIYSLGIDKNKSKQSQTPFCKLCEQHLACRSSVGRSLLYRPMLLSMVGIAAVCVCVGLLFKGPPEVMFVYPPFRWELLESGYI